MPGAVSSGLARYDGLLERCPRCERAVQPLHTTRLPRSLVCVYECACRHSWFTSFLLAAYGPQLGASVGAEPVRVGDVL